MARFILFSKIGKKWHKYRIYIRTISYFVDRSKGASNFRLLSFVPKFFRGEMKTRLYYSRRAFLKDLAEESQVSSKGS